MVLKNLTKILTPIIVYSDVASYTEQQGHPGQWLQTLIILIRALPLSTTGKNNRENGIHGPKRIKTMDQRQCTCFFQFMVKCEVQLGFYIQLEKSAGQSYHLFHPKVLDSSSIPFPTQLLTMEQIENTLHVVNASDNKGTGRNYLRLSIGKYISLIKISYLSQKACGKNHSTTNDIEVMIINFKESNEIACISFSDVPVQDFLEDVTGDDLDDADNSNFGPKTTVTVSTCKLSPTNITLREITNVNLTGRVTEERKERKLSCTDGLFIAVAWILKPALRFFMLCPEVFFVDVTLHSNNKGYYLLTISSRSSIGKQVMWMWIFIPNQQRFSFRWVFQEAIPVLLPKWLRDRVVFFMKDGDQQQRNEILGAMTNVFVNAVEGTSGFHVVNMGWKKHVPPIGISHCNLKKWTVVVTKIHSWI